MASLLFVISMSGPCHYLLVLYQPVIEGAMIEPHPSKKLSTMYVYGALLGDVTSIQHPYIEP